MKKITNNAFYRCFLILNDVMLCLKSEKIVFLIMIFMFNNFFSIKKKNPVLALIIIVIANYSVYSQSATVSSGGDYTSDTGSVSFTVGQPFLYVYSNSDFSITEGLQQPIEASSLNIDEPEIEGVFSIYPIPTANHITLKISDFNIDRLVYEIIDLQGKLLIKNDINVNETKIDIHHLEQSIYLLNIKKQGKLIQTAKIIKL